MLNEIRINIFFDRCQCTIDNGFYLEAVLMEYAIEARREFILGMLWFPCNQYICNEDRRKINISHRVIVLVGV